MWCRNEQGQARPRAKAAAGRGVAGGGGGGGRRSDLTCRASSVPWTVDCEELSRALMAAGAEAAPCAALTLAAILQLSRARGTNQ